MTCEPVTRAAAGDAEADGFHLRVRAALGALDAGALTRWESDGHVPIEPVVELGRQGIFRERWEQGAEGGLSYLIALSEEACSRSSGLALAVMGHSEMFIGALQRLAESPAQRELLDEALDGTVVGCFAATEGHGGSNLAGIRTAAVAVAGGWRLRGCKRYVSNLGGASHVLLLAAPDTAKHPGDLGLFVVPMNRPGVVIDGFFDTVGVHSCDVGQLSVDVELPHDALLGNACLGLLYASYLLNFERVSICAQLLASAQTALRLAAAYARQRTLGGSRLMDRQVIRHRLAWCQAELWSVQSRLRELTARAREQQSMPGHEIAALKLIAGECAGRTIDAAMQVFGARGCTTNFPMERLWRDCRIARLGGGTDEVLADLVASGLDRQDREFERLLSGYLAADLPRSEAGRGWTDHRAAEPLPDRIAER
jgi:alkylation response protein AidB-like acyl-CoA dehydrogenase